MELYKRLLLLATALALCVVVLGAYVRLSDAGLGCPDWPGCYGQLVVPHGEARVSSAQAAYPDKPLEHAKAWKEMAHRYLAGTLGLLILAISATAWVQRRRTGIPIALPTALLLLVVFQAMLGMWTVTLLLKPAIVSAHLLGGMATLALLAWLAHRQLDASPFLYVGQDRDLLPWVRLGLLILAVQIFLGGWTSSNYAALACGEFPACHGRWWPDMDFASAFHMLRALGEAADGAPLSQQALNAIHWSHRVGALVTLLYLGGLALATLGRPALLPQGILIIVLLTTQVLLGIANVVLQLPLPLATAHNAVAALLLVSMAVLHSKTKGMHTRRIAS